MLTNVQFIGKFSIYDLRTKTTSERDLFVTHKLFSLATLDVSSSSNAVITNKSNSEKLSIPNSTLHRYNTGGSQTPLSNTSHLRFSTTPRHGTSLNEGSRSSSKISLNGLANSFNKKSITSQSNTDDEDTNEDEDDDDDDVIINKRATDLIASDTDTSSNSDDEEDNSDYESVPWSEGSENGNEPGCDLFVACAWNGVTYLIDWSKRIGDDCEDEYTSNSSDTENEEEQEQRNSKIKYQLVKFAFEGRVCAFTAGLYSVENQVNVPCLFYVDFEDQIYVYYDVRISPGPVTGFIDNIDDDVEEALDRIIGIESGIDALSESNYIPKKKRQQGHDDDPTTIDLGDGWKGIADDEEEDENENDDITPVTLSHEQQQLQQDEELDDSDPLSKVLRVAKYSIYFLIYHFDYIF